MGVVEFGLGLGLVWVFLVFFGAVELREMTKMKVDKKTFNLMGSGELRISYPFEFTNLFFSLLPQTTLPAKSMVLIRRNFAMVNYFWKRKILSARRTEVFSLCISI